MPDLTGFATLQDFASRQGFDKKYQRIIELQSKTNKILKIMPFKMCNSKDYEEATLRYSLPEVAWRMINRGLSRASLKLSKYLLLVARWKRWLKSTKSLHERIICRLLG